VWLNPPEAVQEAANKLLTLQALTEAEVPTLEYTTHYDEMLHWLNNGEKVIARTMLRASSGRGIEVLHQDDDFALVAPLYTRYFKGYDEYRVHVFGLSVFDVQQKRRRQDFDEVDNVVRSYERGWVFCRAEVAPPDCVLDAATDAVSALGLDFGAVDVKYNRHHDRCAVLEVNTAPGLQGSTLGVYADALSQLVEENQ
jgi:glutathione synthase/RimK-type ligase-like ATP-grasp enzyme